MWTKCSRMYYTKWKIKINELAKADIERKTICLA